MTGPRSTRCARHGSSSSTRTSPRNGDGVKSKRAEWQLALPLGLAFAALFLAPFLLLLGVSFYNDDQLTHPGIAQWVKFFGDPFHYKVIADTLLLGVKTVCA